MKTTPCLSDARLTFALTELRSAQMAVVTGLAEPAGFGGVRETSQSLLTRLRDLGFVPGARCEVVARMWLGGDPLAVRIGGSTFALRRAEAAAVRVQMISRLDAAPVAPAREGSGAVAA